MNTHRYCLLAGVLCSFALTACSTPHPVLDLADKTAANSGILSAQLNKLSLTYSQLAELRAENIAQLHAANTAIRARYIYDLELTKKSGGQDNLKLIDEIEEWQKKVQGIFISSGEAEKHRKEAVLQTQTKLDTKAESLNSIAQTLASLAKDEPYKERAKFLGLYAKSMKDELDKQLAKDELSSKEAKSLLEEVKQQIKK